MQLFDSFSYCTIPPLNSQTLFPECLSIEVGVVAGGLYFDNQQCEDILAWLGICKDVEASSSEGTGNSSAVKRYGTVSRGLFIAQPLKFLQEWLTYRRQGQDITYTPMGSICQGRRC